MRTGWKISVPKYKIRNEVDPKYEVELKPHVQEKSGSCCIKRTRPLFLRLGHFWCFSHYVSSSAVI